MSNWLSEVSRRYVNINNAITTLKSELYLNDVVLNSELDARIASNYDRAVLAAELFRERLEALAQSSRSQVWRVQCGNIPVVAADVFTLDYDSWTAKRRKPNYGEGYSHDSITNYQAQPINKRKRRKKRQSNKTTASATNRAVPATKATVPATKVTVPATKATASAKKATAVATKATTSAVKTTVSKSNTVGDRLNIVKNFIPKRKPIASQNTPGTKQRASATATKISTLSGTSAANHPALVQVKTEPNDNVINTIQNTPSLFSKDISHIKLQFAESDRITIKSKNDPLEQVRDKSLYIKTEPFPERDMMVDDLADHL